MKAAELGLGLLSIGRTWGVSNVLPPDEVMAERLIETAFASGIRFFDTAPAYARSELILGRVLRRNPALAKDSLVATKMGEHWDERSQTSWVSHEREDLVRSLENSLSRLGRIDILQIHKASAANVGADAVLETLDHARTCDVRQFGVSVSDLETAELACKSGQYAFVQFAFNRQNEAMKPAFDLLAARGMRPIVNRPLAMGALANGEPASLAAAYKFVLEHMSSGVVLTGTSREAHLLQNVAAFQAAVRKSQ
ncbi:aldo/keto reductase [Bradyrhizobium ontarionense]|uniref:Aldo/keto reductase n=1 Tax=Bradyrhizobium ontarionense TaxID=2898149 RepID=A0ABY3RCM0_9BRAD|nr:aldo/keto reductase [Bradyrhizobium sp. A19]UFZ04971.1 aldo/keto reductase [Bradyrhizobium sp. A19]